MSLDTLPQFWEQPPIELCCDLNPRLDKTEISDSKLVHFVPMPAVEALTNKVDVSATRPFVDVKKGYTYFASGDVIFAKITPCMENGKVAVVPDLQYDLAYGSTEFHVIRPLADLPPLWFFYYLSSRAYRSVAEHNMTGAVGQRRVPIGFIAQTLIPLPPLNEQRRIVAKIEELFSELDAGEESLRRARRLLGVYRQSLLKQAFEGKLTAQWRKQNPKSKNSQEVTVGDIAEIKSGNGFPLHYQGLEDGDYPFFKVGDISRNFQAGRRRLGRAGHYITAEILKRIRGTVIPKDATVFAKIGAAVALNRRALTSEPSLIDNNAMALIPSDALDPNFLFLFMCQIDLGEKTRGGAVPSLRKGDIEEIPIRVPSLPEQQEIVRLLDEQFTTIEQNEREIDAALKRSAALRQSILKKAFTGQLVPQDPADEPAAVLLERIRKERGTAIKVSQKTILKPKIRS